MEYTMTHNMNFSKSRSYLDYEFSLKSGKDISVRKIYLDSLNKFEEYKHRVDKKLNEIDAKMSFLNQGVKGLSEAFKDFQSEMTDFMSFAAESFSDHETRIKNLENKLS